jgi:integrase
MPPTERAGRSTADRESVKVSPRRIGTAAQVHAVLAAVGTEPAWRAHAAAALRTIYATGCRPGEVLALTGPDVQGSVVYFGASRTQPGSAWSDGETTHTGPLKHRARNAVRAVPVADAAVAAELTERAVKGGRLFPVSEGQLSQAWREARAAVADGTWPAERLARVYDLRHQHASLGLNAGVSPVEMGRRLGHSPEVCLTVYADVISTDADRWTAVLAAALA